jgi:hypothetical protein
MHSPTCTHPHALTHMHSPACTHPHALTHMRSPTRAHPHALTHMHAPTRTHPHALTHMHALTCTHPHARHVDTPILSRHDDTLILSHHADTVILLRHADRLIWGGFTVLQEQPVRRHLLDTLGPTVRMSVIVRVKFGITVSELDLLTAYLQSLTNNTNQNSNPAWCGPWCGTQQDIIVSQFSGVYVQPVRHNCIVSRLNNIVYSCCVTGLVYTI